MNQLGLLPGESGQTVDVQEDDGGGDEELEQGAHPVFDLGTLAGVGLGQEVVPAPTVFFSSTEEYVNQRTERKNIITDDEILKILNITCSAEGMEIGKNVKSENARNREDYQSNHIYKTRLLSTPAPLIHTE